MVTLLESLLDRGLELELDRGLELELELDRELGCLEAAWLAGAGAGT